MGFFIEAFVDRVFVLRFLLLASQAIGPDHLEMDGCIIRAECDRFAEVCDGFPGLLQGHKRPAANVSASARSDFNSIAWLASRRASSGLSARLIVLTAIPLSTVLARTRFEPARCRLLTSHSRSPTSKSNCRRPASVDNLALGADRMTHCLKT